MTAGPDDDAESNAMIWAALRSDDPVDALTDVVRTWRDDGCTQPVSEDRLTRFLENEIVVHGTERDDDAVRDVLDFVVGWCSAHQKLYP